VKRLPPKAIGLKKAMEMMHRHGTRLVQMHTDSSPDGLAHYVIPGGYVEPDVAEKIKSHPLVRAGEDGLFPGHDQTWRMGK
jgi:hypothetical protein